MFELIKDIHILNVNGSCQMAFQKQLWQFAVSYVEANSAVASVKEKKGNDEYF